MQDLLNGLAQGGVYALTGVGLVLIFSVVRVPNFAHGEPVMLGAVLPLVLATAFGLNLALGIVAGIAGAAAMGWMFSAGVFGRLRSHPEVSLLIVSLALVVMIESVAVMLVGDAPRTFPGAPTTIIYLPGGQMPLTWAIILAAALLATGGLLLFVRYTDSGRIMRAMALNPYAAQLMGIPVGRYQTLAFVIGSALAGLGGGLYGLAFPVQATMGAVIALKAFIVIIFAGMGSIGGALAGGLLLGVVESFGASYISTGYKDTFGFVFLLLVLLLKPDGLFGQRETR